MAKHITLHINSAKETLETVQIAANEGRAVRVKAQANVRYQLVDNATQFGPENIMTKRVGQDLHISFEGSGVNAPDLIIEDYYAVNGQIGYSDGYSNLIIGQHENGSFYAYVPESAQQADAVSMLADQMTAGQALGGTEFLTAFWLPAATGSLFSMLAPLAMVGTAAAVAAIAGNSDDNGSGSDGMPVAANDSATGVLGQNVTVNVLANDRDPDGTLDPASVNLVDPATGELVKLLNVPGEGVWNVNPDGSITFTPNTDFVGDPTPVTYEVRDNQGNPARAQVSIDYDQPPVANNDESLNNPRGEAVTVQVLTNDQDENKAGLTVELLDAAGDPVNSLTVQGEGTWTVNADRTVTFQPEANFSGDPTPVPYRITDESGQTDEALITVTYVEPGNEAPIADDDRSENNPIGPVTVKVLDNDTDADGNDTLDPESVRLIDPNGQPVTELTVPGEGVWTVDTDTGEVTFTPDPDFTGNPTPVRYQVADDKGDVARANIVITYNQKPVAVDDTDLNNTRGEAVSVNVIDNDNDPENALNPSSIKLLDASGQPVDSLTVSGQGVWTVDSNNPGYIIFTPEAGFQGNPTPVRYQVADDKGQTAEALVTVTYVDPNSGNPPVAQDDSKLDQPVGETVTLNVLANDSDADSTPNTNDDLDPDTLQLVDPASGELVDSLTVPGEGTWTVGSNGEVTFAPAANFTGNPTPVEYQIADKQGNVARATITVTYKAENQKPVAEDDQDLNNTRGDSVEVYVLGNDSDPENRLDPTSVKLMDGNTPVTTLEVPGEGVWTVNPNKPGHVTFTPAAGFSGSPTPVTYQVSDQDGESATALITVTYVDPTNDNQLPYAGDDKDLNNIIGEPVTVSVLENDGDQDGQLKPETVKLLDANGDPVDELEVPNEGKWTVDPATGDITFTPESGFTGNPTPVTYQVEDDQGGVATATVTVTYNQPPTVVVTIDPDFKPEQGAAQPGDVVATSEGSDPNDPASELEYSITPNSDPEGYYAIDPETGTVTLTDAGAAHVNNGGNLPPVKVTIKDPHGATGVNEAPVDPTDAYPVVSIEGVATVDEGSSAAYTIKLNEVSDKDVTVKVRIVFGQGSGHADADDLTFVEQTVTIPAGQTSVNVAVPITADKRTEGTETYTIEIFGPEFANLGTDKVVTEIQDTSVTNPPVAVNDTYDMHEGGDAIVLNPLNGDTDPDGDNLSIVSINGQPLTPGQAQAIPVTGGVVNVSADGEITFKPNDHFNGTVTFPYTITDGMGGTAEANQVIRVAPVNSAPDGTHKTFQNVAAGQTFILGVADFGFRDPNDTPANNFKEVIVEAPVGGGVLTYKGSPVTAPVTVTVAELNAGDLVYTAPVGAATSSPTINFKVVDDGGTANGGQDTDQQANTLTFAVGANTPPTAQANTVSTLEDNAKTFAATEFKFIDQDANPSMTAVRIDSLPTKGSLKLDGMDVTVGQVINAADLGKLVYTPPADDNGNAYTSFTYSVRDNGNAWSTAPATMTINVTPVNDAPAGADKNFGTVAAGSSTVLKVADFGFSDTKDAGKEPASHSTFKEVLIQLPTGGGQLLLNGTALTAETRVSVADIEAGKLVYRAPSGTTASTPSINFQVVDNGGTANGGKDTDETPNTLRFSVSAANQPPVNTLPATGYTTPEDTVKALDGISVADPDGGILTTELKVNHGTLAIDGSNGGATVTGAGTGTLTLSGTAAQINAALANLKYTNTPDWNGDDTLTVKTTDSAGASDIDTAPIKVTEVVDIQNDAIVTAEDTAVTVNLLANDSFEGSNPQITAINGQPISVGSSITITDANGLPRGTLTLKANGEVEFNPHRNYHTSGNPSLGFTYTVTSGGVTETANVTIAITAVNDAPVNTVPGAQTVAEDGTLSISTISVADVDSPNLTTTLSVTKGTLTVGFYAGVNVSTNGTGQVVISGPRAGVNEVLKTLQYKPTADYNGQDILTVHTSDGALADTDTVAITVTPVRDAVNDSATTPQNTPVNIKVLDNDHFEDPNHSITAINGSSVTVGVPVTVANGTVTLKADGTVDFVPNNGYNGITTFTYTVTSHGAGVSENATVRVRVGNRAPTVQNGTAELVENEVGTATEIQLRATDADNDALTYNVSGVTITSSVPGNTFTVTASGTNQWTISNTDQSSVVRTGTLTLNPTTGKLTLNEQSGPNGSVFDTLAKDANVEIKVNFRANDGTTNSSTAVQTIKVTGVNDIAEVGQTQRAAITVNTTNTSGHTARGDRSVFDVDHGEQQLVTFDGQRAGIDVTDLTGLYGHWTLADKGDGTGVDWVYEVDANNIAVKSLLNVTEDPVRLADHLNILSLDHSAALTPGERQMPSAIITSRGMGVTTTKLNDVTSAYNGTSGEDGVHVKGNVSANINMGNGSDALFIRGDAGGVTIDMGSDNAKDYVFLQNLNGTVVNTGGGDDVVTIYGTIGNGTKVDMGAGSNDTLLVFRDVLIDNTQLSIQGVERLDMRNGDANTVTISGQALAANGSTDLRIIAGDQNDTVKLSGGFTDNGNGTYSYTAGGQTYTIHDEMKIGFQVV
ncbi:CshA-type fibril repeat protein [Neisseria sp. HSC-16F19]|nr:Ig-like domain-containing protein [Neisseria sp. HSC-16F19]MCP2040408.1 CshA-type fibril repeat protein [Neisseria sp. HSC-16F19]